MRWPCAAGPVLIPPVDSRVPARETWRHLMQTGLPDSQGTGGPPLTVVIAATAHAAGQVIERALLRGGLDANTKRVRDRDGLRTALLHAINPIVIVADGDPGLPLNAVLAEGRVVGTPPVIVAGVGEELDWRAARELLAAGASDVVQSGHLDRLALAVEVAAQRQHSGLPANRQAAALAALAAALRATTSREAMLPVVIESVQRLLGVEGAALLRSNPSSDQLMVEAADGWLDTPGAKWPAAAGLAGQALRSSRPLAAALAPPMPESTALAQMLDLSSAAYAPLVAQGQAIGVLAVASRTPIQPAQFDLLDAIADMVASALYRAALHEDTEQRLRRLAALHAVDLAISTSFDLRVTLGIALDHLMSQTRVDAVGVLLLHHAAQTLEYAAVRGFQTGLLRQAPMRASQTLAGRVIAQRQPLHLANLAAEAGQLPPMLQGFASYYGVPLLAKGRVHGVLELLSHNPLPLDPDWVEFVASLATQAAIAVDNASLFADLQRTNAELNLAYDATIEGWARVLEARGIESLGHTGRVAELAVRTGRAAGLSDTELFHLRRGALLHDIGMLRVPEAVLLQTGPLSPEDRSHIQQHPDYGFDILAPINHLRPALDIPRCHHERWDGAGYPRGLRGEQIPLTARLFSVVDVWDALCADRPFRRAWPEARARDYLRENAGTQFDPQAVHLFCLSLNGSH